MDNNDFLFILNLMTFIGVLILFTSFAKSKQEIKLYPFNSKDSLKIKDYAKSEDMYELFRNLAFAMTPEKLCLTISNDETTVIGIVMDWGVKAGVATTVCFLSGDASIYYSSGGGIIGGGNDKKVSQSAIAFVKLAQEYFENAIKTDKYLLPSENEIMFYFITNIGVYFGIDQINNLKNDSSHWSKLFDEGNNVITELRIMSGQ